MHAGLVKNDSGRVQISGLEKTSSLKKTNCMQKLSTFLYQTFFWYAEDLMKDQVLSKNVFIS